MSAISAALDHRRNRLAAALSLTLAAAGLRACSPFHGFHRASDAGARDAAKTPPAQGPGASLDAGADADSLTMPHKGRDASMTSDHTKAPTPAAECLQRLLSLPAHAHCLERCEDLELVRADLAGVFALGADLDCSAQTHKGAGFLPIGTPTAPFTGKLFGYGHAITGLRVERPKTDDVGLIVGRLGPLSAVSNAYSNGVLVGDTGRIVGEHDLSNVTASFFDCDAADGCSAGGAAALSSEPSELTRESRVNRSRMNDGFPMSRAVSATLARRATGNGARRLSRARAPRYRRAFEGTPPRRAR